MIRIKRFFYRFLDIFKFIPFRIFLLTFIVLFSYNVYADDFNVSSTITAPNCNGSQCNGGKYRGLEIYNSGSENIYNVNTRYSGRLSRIIFRVPVPNNFEGGAGCYSVGDLTYRLTINMATEDWRNYFTTPFISSSASGSNWATSGVVFVSYKKIYFNFRIPTTSTCIESLYVDLKSSNVSSTAFTGVSNWNLSSVVLTANFPTSSGGGGSSVVPTSTPAPSGANNQDIINNQNSNTNNIINNQNSNTNNIINNQNSNTQNIIDSESENTNNIIENNNSNTQQIIDSNNANFNDCFNTFNNSILQSGKYYNQTGSLISGNGMYYSKIYKIEPSSTITITDAGSSNKLGVWYILWDENMTYIDYYYIRNRITILPSNARYFAMSIDNTSINVSINTGFCTSKIDSMNQGINDVNNTMKDDNIDDNTGFFTNFSDNDHGLSSIITIPLSTIQQLTNTTCVPLQVPIPFTNETISLPCMTEVYQNAIPTIFSLWQVVSFGIIAYLICLDIFHIVKGFKDPNEDKVEVLDL